ncbi:MAG: hypothetical protein ABJK25_11470 [Halieaceae bacterium]
MVMGHYATALIPYAYESNRKLAPFWFFLLATQALDFIMVTLVVLGVETVEPTGFFDASFRHMVVDMTYSHDIAPALVWSLVFAGIAAIAFKSLKLAAIVLGLTVLHESMDLLVGFEHYWFGLPETEDAAVFGFGLYNSAPVMGILIEAVICSALIIWYVKKRAATGKPVSTFSQRLLWAVLVGATLGLLAMANQSLASLFT